MRRACGIGAAQACSRRRRNAGGADGNREHEEPCVGAASRNGNLPALRQRDRYTPDEWREDAVRRLRHDRMRSRQSRGGAAAERLPLTEDADGRQAAYHSRGSQRQCSTGRSREEAKASSAGAAFFASGLSRARWNKWRQHYEGCEVASGAGMRHKERFTGK